MSKEKKKIVDSNAEVNDLAFHYWGTINYFIRLIKSSELKAGLILSFYGILLNFVYKNVELTKEHLLGEVFAYILLGLWLLR